MTAVLDPVAATTPAPRRRQGRRNITLTSALVLLAVLLLLAFAVGPLSPYDVNAIGEEPLQGPSGSHWFGTDNLGRDVFTRVAVATRYGLLISLLSTALAAVAGTLIGLFAGYLGGWFDQLSMRLVDILLAVPAILLALVVRVIVGPGLWPLVIALAIIFTPTFARVMRAPALVLREREFVLAAQVNGVSTAGITLRHVLPNALTPLLVNFANTASVAVLLEASLSYLGQGVQPPDPSAGRMINESQRFLQEQPMLLIGPALLIVVMTVAWNLLADGLQERLSPRRSQLQVPTSRRRRAAMARSAQARAATALATAPPGTAATPADPSGDPPPGDQTVSRPGTGATAHLTAPSEGERP